MTLQLHLTVLILIAAFTHAAWNAMIKASGDRVLTFATMRGVDGVVALAVIPFLPLPAPEAWPYLIVSTIIHNVYYGLLLYTYRHGELNQVYPLARGSAPLLVAVLAAWLAGEVPSMTAGVGILLVSGGIVGIALTKGLPRGADVKPILLALATGLGTAGYTVADGLGTRLAGDPFSYIAWLFLLEGVSFVAIAAGLRRRGVVAHMIKHWRPGVAGGLLAIFAYGLVLYALSQGAMAHVAALRETSVLFAALIGTFLLKESFGPRRIAAAALIVAGIVLLQVSR
jgi:drug/metabolite transporter (DMT)-like permease